MGLSRGWTNTIDAGLTDPSARRYDATIDTTVTEYNTRLTPTTGYVPADWKLIRAMIWVESGGPKASAWNGRVMQIGNAGDPGYNALRNGEGAAPLVVALATLQRIAAAKPGDINDPFFNIEVGIGYVWTRLCRTDMGMIVDDPTERTHTVGPKGEIASRLVQSEGTTLQDLQALNPGINVNALTPGAVLRIRRTHTGRRIKDWLAFTPENIARTYNVGDPAYADKLRYVMSVINW